MMSLVSYISNVVERAADSSSGSVDTTSSCLQQHDYHLSQQTSSNSNVSGSGTLFYGDVCKKNFKTTLFEIKIASDENKPYFCAIS